MKALRYRIAVHDSPLSHARGGLPAGIREWYVPDFDMTFKPCGRASPGTGMARTWWRWGDSWRFSPTRRTRAAGDLAKLRKATA